MIYVEKCLVVRVDLPAIQSELGTDEDNLFGLQSEDITEDGIVTLTFNE